jgi:hypothetical protein
MQLSTNINNYMPIVSKRFGRWYIWGKRQF